MARARYYGRYTLVAVHIPPECLEHNKPLEEFNGMCYEVKTHKPCGTSFMYTLNGCRSRMGEPYWFAHEWLERVK